jgi:hypothetical protein
MLLAILRQYLAVFSKPRYLTQPTIPDGSAILDCLAFGFTKLIEEFERGDDALLTEPQLQKVRALEARISQVANSSKLWSSEQEWELTHSYAWEVIDAMGWRDQISN